MGIIYLIIVGAIAGWLASLIMKGRGSGLIMNIIIGILGAIIGNWATDYFIFTWPVALQGLFSMRRWGR